MRSRRPSSDALDGRAVRLRAFLAPSGRTREAVHDLHRGLRRDRFEGQILGRVLGASRGRRDLERAPALRELERCLGRWRDVGQSRDLWRSVRSGSAGAREVRWLAARERSLDQEADECEREAVRIVQRFLQRAPPQSPAVRAAPGRVPVREPRRQWREELGARRRRYRRALGRLSRSLAPEPAHAFRQELRRLSLFYELLSTTSWAVPPRRGGRLRRVLDRLGRVHDLDRAIERIRQEPRSGLRREYRRRLRDERRRTAELAWADLGSKAVRRYATRGLARKG